MVTRKVIIRIPAPPFTFKTSHSVEKSGFPSLILLIKNRLIDQHGSARSTGSTAHSRIPPIRCEFRKCGHLLINQKILSNSPFGRTTQMVVAFQRQNDGPSARFEILKKQHGTGPPGTNSLNALLLMRALAQASFVTAKGTRKCSATTRKTRDAVWAAG
jgi:hypothetical protein